MQTSVYTTLVPVGAAPDIHHFDTSAAYTTGAEDAAAGDAFAPEWWFANDRMQASYTTGFLSIRPDCFAANAWWAEFLEAQYAYTLEDDYQWIREGC